MLSGSEPWPNYLYYGAGAAKFVFVQDPAADPPDVEPREMKERFGEVSKLMDAVDPDLSAVTAEISSSSSAPTTPPSRWKWAMRYYESVYGELGEAALTTSSGSTSTPAPTTAAAARSIPRL